MIKVVVNTFLNVRVGQPSLGAPCYQYLAPGSELEVDEVLHKGDRYEGSDNWFRDQAGNYYWAGGVERKPTASFSQSDFWFQKLSIESIWGGAIGEKGDRARVLVLDSGINNNLKALKEAVDDAFPIYVPEVLKQTTGQDRLGHGTHCAGLIAARPSDYKVGVAPEAKLLIGKIMDNEELPAATLKEALEEFLDDKYQFDIISLSFAVPQNILEDQEIESLLNRHVAKKRIIVAAIGNDKLLSNSPFKRYPGCFNCCIAVGACENDFNLAKYTFIPKDRPPDIYCFGSSIGSFMKFDRPEPLIGTSQATAIVAGICALVVSFLKKNAFSYDAAAVKALLSKYSLRPTNQENYRIIYPSHLFTKLLNFKNNVDKNLQHCIDNDLADIPA